MINESGRVAPWFDGYDGTSPIIFNEFNGEVKISVMCNLVDRYDYIADKKHGHVICTPAVVIITSNNTPTDWYGRERMFDAFKRRVGTNIEFFECVP